MARRTSPRAKPRKKRRPALSPAAAKSGTNAVRIPHSQRSGIRWPAMPAFVDATVLALQYQLEQSQWWPPETLVEHQLRQLELLVVHTARTVPFYRGRLDALSGLGRGELTMDAWRRLPVLARTDIQDSGAALVSRRLPRDHGQSVDVSTSGSTGRPVTVKGTAVTGLFSRALNLRYYLWHGHDFSSKMARISVLRQSEVDEQARHEHVTWVHGYLSGPYVEFDASRPTAEQLAWLKAENPDHLLTYPSNLLALLQRCEESGVRIPALRDVATVGEVLEPDVRAVCERVWGVSVTDGYSAQEVGMIAIQCPEHPHYHVQSETVLVEILDGDGKPCAPGGTGRLVVTDLHNFATPLIRYEIGDYAEVGEPCLCGRGLPVITRILGRTRNMATLPSGEQTWPRFHGSRLGKIAPVRQAQLIQRSLEEIQVNLVVTRPVTTAEEDRLRETIREGLGYRFALSFVYVDEIPRAASGKFEEFLSLVEK